MTDLNALNAAVQADKGAAKSVKAWINAATPLLEPPTPPSGYGSVSGRWFTASSYINRGRPSNPVIALNSAAMIDQLVAQAVQGVYFNMDVNSVAVYPVPDTTAKVSIFQTRDGSHTLAPFTPAMKTPGDPTTSDGHVTAMLESGPFWETQQYGVQGQYTCQGMCPGNVVTGDGTPQPTGQISNLPTPVGLLRPRNFARGYVPDHGLRFAIPTASSSAVWPATRSDGSGGLIPMGSCIWLPPSASIAGLNPYQTVAAKMWQAFGGWCGDSNGNAQAVTGFVEATTDGSSYPFTGLSLPVALLAQAHVLAPQSP